MRFTTDDVQYCVSHYITYLGEVIRDINQRLLGSQPKKTENDVFAKVTIEVRHAYSEFAKIASSSDMSTLQNHLVQQMREVVVNEGNQTYVPPWGSTLTSLTIFFRELETRLSTPHSPSDK